MIENRLEIAGEVRAGKHTFHSAGEQPEGTSHFNNGDSRRDEVDGIVEQALASFRIRFDQVALEQRAAVDVSGHSAPRSSASNCSMVIDDATRSIGRKGRRLRAGEIQPSATPMRRLAGMTSAEVGSGATMRAVGRP